MGLRFSLISFVNKFIVSLFIEINKRDFPKGIVVIKPVSSQKRIKHKIQLFSET